MNEEIKKIENDGTNKIKEPVLRRGDYFLPGSIVLAALIISVSWIYTTQLQFSGNPVKLSEAKTVALEEKALHSKGVSLPVRWGDLGIQLTNSGVIDRDKFMALYDKQGGLPESDKKLLDRFNNSQIVITPYNANFLLNLFWALGLGNRNEILEKGEMADKKYGGADKFASTGGWSLAKGKAMDHYSMHKFMNLNPEQQAMVERVSKGIYRPCCGNSTHFPDCNHGMAMFGLLELMALQGVSEKDMYEVALQVNAYWFPDTYLTIATYLESKGSSWEKADPKELLGAEYSSSAGYQKILSQVVPQTQKGGGSCGV